MMDDPFFQHYWNQSPYLHREAPRSRRREPSVDNLGQTQTPKVIHIPVFGPEETEAVSKPVAATRIQKVFRGYLVRKCVKKIKGIKKEVDEIDKEVSVELFRRDDKKRLKVNELLMRLLLKLDSVRGVDSGVRDCRKAVIKKVIMLQERLDNVHDQTETNCKTQENWEIVDQVMQCESFGQISIEDDYCSAANQFECTEFEPLLVAKQVCAKELSSAEKENLEEAEHEEEDDSEEGKATMDRIVKENERLRRKVMLLCDSNKQQNNLIKALSKRVDHLEKDFKSEKAKSSRKRRQSLLAQELFF
ncbi:hypothetical protein IFM89_025985 [Coptis chinensis]|uniref:BAG domain-containing protein n=1 Tax=Coptis chinensis TaxID=261450 RepID=A0A835I6D6_9MAGN|nr:hypothetical protein IFM89_025985 [Coptis chinensis]